MKSLHVISPLPAGGAETVVLNLTTGLQAAGHPAVIAALIGQDETNHPFVTAARVRGITVVEIREGHRRYDRQTQGIQRAAREHRVDVIHTHAPLADVMGKWAANQLRLPMVSTLHGFTSPGRGRLLQDMAVQWAHRGADALIAVSSQIVSRLESRRVPRERIRLLPNAWYPGEARLSGSEARSALGIGPHVKHIGWVGRFAIEKAVDVFVDAVAALRDPSVAVSIVGDGKLRADVEARARAAGVFDQIRWHGTIAAAERILPAFDLLVMSSRSEGTPMVLLEAMAAEVPIVATNVGGIPQMLAPSEAMLVPPERPDLLATAIRESLDDLKESTTRARHARARLERDYSAAKWIQSHVTLYEELVNARGIR